MESGASDQTATETSNGQRFPSDNKQVKCEIDLFYGMCKEYISGPY